MKYFSTLLELAGIALLTLAAFLVTPALGFAVAGIGTLVLGMALGHDPSPAPDKEAEPK